MTESLYYSVLFSIRINGLHDKTICPYYCDAVQYFFYRQTNLEKMLTVACNEIEIPNRLAVHISNASYNLIPYTVAYGKFTSLQ